MNISEIMLNVVLNVICIHIDRWKLVCVINITAKIQQKLQAHAQYVRYLISNFRRVLVACFLLGNSPTCEFYMPTFRDSLFHLNRRHIKFRPREITQ